MATGSYTARQVLDRLTALGLTTRPSKSLGPQSFGRMLRNPLYAGFFKSSLLADQRSGDWEPIVPEQTFNRVQAILTGRRPTVAPKQRNHPDFPLRRFVRCGGCDRNLTAQWAKGRTTSQPYYRCGNTNCRGEGRVHVRKEVLESTFSTLHEGLQTRRKYTALLRELVRDVWNQRQAETGALRRRLGKNLKKLTERKSRLVDAYIDRAIDRETYDGKLDELNEAIALAQMEENEARLDELDVEGALAFGEHLLLNTARCWTHFDLNQKQRFQQILFPEGLVFDQPSGAYRTAVTSPIFSYLHAIPGNDENVASPS